MHDWSGQELERDYGAEVLWRFADIDPFARRSDYFGPSRDIATYEQFKSQLYSRPFQPLMRHTSSSTRSELCVSPREYWRRFEVTDEAGTSAVFEVVMVKADAGVHAGLWRTRSLRRASD